MSSDLQILLSFRCYAPAIGLALLRSAWRESLMSTVGGKQMLQIKKLLARWQCSLQRRRCFVTLFRSAPPCRPAGRILMIGIRINNILQYLSLKARNRNTPVRAAAKYCLLVISSALLTFCLRLIGHLKNLRFCISRLSRCPNAYKKNPVYHGLHILLSVG